KREEYNSFNIEVTKVHGELNNYENEIIRNEENTYSRQNTIQSRLLESEQYEFEINNLRGDLESFSDGGLRSGLKPRLEVLEHDKASIEADFTTVRSEYEIKRGLSDKVELEQKALRSSRDEIIDFIHKNEMQLTKDRIEI